MENATQFGIYKIITLCILNILGLDLIAQDYYVDLNGNKHEFEVTDWNLDKVNGIENDNEITLVPNQVKCIYREIAQVNYIPIDSLLNNQNHQPFFIPSTQSIYNLSVDNFRDENYEIWQTGDYVIYEIQRLGQYFTKVDDVNLTPIEKNDVFIYSDKAGFNKIVTNEIEDDEYKVLLSKYITRASLKDSIFNDEITLKPKKFLSFFDENESALTAVMYNDKDKAEYYIQSLKNNGALIVLLNLDLKKIELYRNSGNDKLANKLEENLLKDNLSYANSFLDSDVFNFCKVYITDAKNLKLILDGVTENIFLNKDLKVDSSIVLKENFYLFAREGVFYETRYENPNFNTQKKIVTSTPVVQDAMVIYGVDNVQVIDPFPNYVRTSTARFLINKKTNKSSYKDESISFDEMIKNLEQKSGLENFNLNALGVVYSFNYMFFKYHKKNENSKLKRNFSWNSNKIYNKDFNSWINNPLKLYSPINNKVQTISNE